MREELGCVHALVQGLAEIRVYKQHIVPTQTHTHTYKTLILPGPGKAQGAKKENILACLAEGPSSEKNRETPVQVWKDLV